jgi:hypothetical protein
VIATAEGKCASTMGSATFDVYRYLLYVTHLNANTARGFTMDASTGALTSLAHLLHFGKRCSFPVMN